MRTLLVTGPGGAGTSTVAAATALAAADSGQRVVLLATAPPEVPGVAERVTVRVVRPGAAVESAWTAHADRLAALVPALTLPPATSVVPVPGTTEVALLVALAGAAEADLVVVDAGPLPAAIALLALPSTLRWWLGQLAPPRLRVLATVRAMTTRGRPGAVEAGVAAAGSLEALLDRVPVDPAVHLVLPPDPRAAETLRSAAVGLGVLGYPVASVTLARVLPAGSGAWADRRAAQQESVRAGLAAAGYPVRVVAEAGTAPSDLASLTALGAALATTSPATLAPPAARRDGADWVLPVPVPGAARGEVELTRWDDELVVAAAGVRRSLPLDSLLRRCAVTSASVVDPGTPHATLTVRFTPDPAQWPPGLLAAEGARAEGAR